MLVKIKPLGKEFEERFLAIKDWPEIYFSDEVKSVLSELKFVEKINKSSIKVKIEPNDKNQKPTHAHLPSQYLLYAVLIKEFALALYDYTRVFQSLKTDLKNAEINQLIVGRLTDHALIQQLSAQEQTNFFDLFGVDDSYALEAKSILKKDGTLRTVKDFFGSVILKVIDVPDTSSEILGKFIYALCEDNTAVYSRLEQLCLKDLPFVVRGSSIGKFANSVLRFLWNYDGLRKLKDSIQTNNIEVNQTIVTDVGRLTSIFRTSSTYLSEAELSSGDKPRYFEDPIFFDEAKLYYVSTEWTFGKDSRLDLETFKKIVELKYPEFKFELLSDVFTLKCVTASIHSRRKIEANGQCIPVILPFCKGVRSRNVMQPWPVSASV